MTTNDSTLEDRIDCVNRSLARLRIDIRVIVREVVKEEYSDRLTELRKPQSYVERGYRS